MTWSDASFGAVAAAVAASTGLVFPPARHAEFEQAMRRALPTMRDADRLRELLEKDDEARETLVAELTVGETYFFRDPAQFTLLRQLLPRLVESIAGRPVRVWSAGCASGEEPYSIAILCDELGIADGVAILGTDLSRSRLAAARRGVYRPWSFRGVPSDVLDRYFERRGVHYHIRPDLRRRVEYRYLNLAEDRFPSLTAGIWGMDVILCRNVLIYFDRETVARVAKRLVETLADDGYLVLGASDPPIGDLTDTTVTHTAAGLVYRRKQAGSTLLPPLDLPETAADNAPAAAPAGPHTRADDRIDWPSDEREGTLAQTGVGAPDSPIGPAMHPAPIVPADAAAWPGAPGRTGTIAGAEAGADAAERAAAAAGGEPVAQLDAAYRSGDYDRVHALAERLTRANTGGVAPWLFRIRAYANRGCIQDASRIADAALDRFTDSAELLYLHAVLLSQSGRHADAAAAARRALYLDPGLVVAHIALANARMRTGDRDAARRALRNAEVLLSRHPQDRPVPASDGQSAARLKQLVRTHLALLAAA